MSATGESLHYWSQLLLWLSIIVPIVGAAIGAAAGVARYYVDRYEKQATAEIHRTELERSKREIEALKKATAPRSLARRRKRVWWRASSCMSQAGSWC